MAKKKIDKKNLVLRGGVWWVEVTTESVAGQRGRRVRFSTETGDLDEARIVRDTWRLQRAVGAEPKAAPVVTFAAMAQRALDENVSHLAPNTVQDRKRQLGHGG